MRSSLPTKVIAARVSSGGLFAACYDSREGSVGYNPAVYFGKEERRAGVGIRTSRSFRRIGSTFIFFDEEKAGRARNRIPNYRAGVCGTTAEAALAFFCGGR